MGEQAGRKSGVDDFANVRAYVEGRRSTWSATLGGLQLKVWRESFPPRPTERWYQTDQLSHRVIHFSISAADRPVAVGHLEEWRVVYPPEDADVAWPGLEDFVVAADEWSQASYDAAKVIRDAWKHHEDFGQPFEYGRVVLFERVRIEAKSRAESDQAWALITDLIKRQWRKQKAARASIIVLKAFPLEFEGAGEVETDQPFKARRAAMMRLYQRRLGAVPLPGRAGQDAWMWVNVNCWVAPGRGDPRATPVPTAT